MKSVEEINKLRTSVLESLATAQGIENIAFAQGVIRGIDLVLLDENQEEVKED